MSNINNLSNTLLQEVSTGDRQAFRVFYDETYLSLYRFVSYFFKNREDREEVLSEVYCIMWMRRDKLLEIDNLKSYMYIIARNESYRILREKSKYHNIAIEDMPIELSIKSISGHDEIIEKEMLAIYAKAVSELPERCKLIYLMVREEKMKHKEVAKILSLTQGTIEKQMNIAIRKIICVVKEYYPLLWL